MSDGPATRYVFVTGGVVSALGKGIVAASLGRLLKSRGLRVQAQKFDPYLNVDPGTMSPFQHGEVYVTEDGAETDLDLGHYERFVDENLSREREPLRGRDLGHGAPQGAQGRVPRRHRAGDPAHHERDQGADPPRPRRRTRPTWSSPRSAARSATSSRCRSSRRSASSGERSGPRTSCYLHVTLVPFIEAAGELKTKPTQHSVNELRRIGIHPDAIVCRSHDELSEDIRDKIALFADVDPRAVFSSPDMPDVYLVPEHLMTEGLDAYVCERLGLETPPADLGEWRELTDRIAEQHDEVEIALVGKYVKLRDAYLSVHEALKHAGVAAGDACPRPVGRRRGHVLRGGRAGARAG